MFGFSLPSFKTWLSFSSPHTLPVKEDTHFSPVYEKSAPVLRAGMVLLALVPVTAIGIVVQTVLVRLNHPWQRKIPLWWHRFACRLLGVSVRLRGQPAEKSALIVANHVSWLDICVLGSILPLSFVAKADVAQWPIFGTLARLQRTVFVDRQRRVDTKRVSLEVAHRLQNQDKIVLFAEGTSSDGNRVLPFRSSLIGALGLLEADSAVAVQPVSVVYTHLHGLPLGRQFRPHVAWYGDMDLIPHLLQIIKHGGLDVTVSFHPVLDNDASVHRKILTKQLESTIREHLSAHVRGVEPLR